MVINDKIFGEVTTVGVEEIINDLLVKEGE